MRTQLIIILLLSFAFLWSCMDDVPDDFDNPESTWNPGFSFPVGYTSLGMNEESGFDTLLLALNPIDSLPEWFRQEIDIPMSYTMPFDMQELESFSEEILRLMVSINAYNGFPTGITGQIYFLDINNDFIDSVFTDELFNLSKGSVDENVKVKNEIQEVTKTKVELEEQNKDLSGKVELASTLRLESLRAYPINKRGKENNKINKIEKIKIDFKIKENVLAEKGERDIYFRIAGPDDYILAKSEEDLFEYQGQQIVFSAKRPVDFLGDDLDVIIFWDNNGALITGTYEAHIFADSEEIASTQFQIKEGGLF